MTDPLTLPYTDADAGPMARLLEDIMDAPDVDPDVMTEYEGGTESQ
jgi:hypothetical protein